MKVSIEKDNLKLIDIEDLASGAINYYEIECEFDESWNELNKVAILVNKDEEGIEIPLVQDKCIITNMLEQGVAHLGFVGYTIENNVKVYQVSTNLKRLPTIKWGAGSVETVEQEVPEPSVFEQYIATINEFINRADEKVRAVENLDIDIDSECNVTITKKDGTTETVNVKGEQGIQGVQGPQGNQGIQGYTPQRGTDYWTEQDKQEIIDDVVQDANNAFNENAAEKLAEFNNNAEQKTSEFNANADELQQRLKDLENNQLPCTVEDKELHITDSANMEIVSFDRLIGDMTQKTTKGYNLMPIPKSGSKVSNGMITSYDGKYFNYNGTITATWFALLNDIAVNIPAGTYNITKYEATNTTRPVITFFYEDGTTKNIYLNVKENHVQSVTFEQKVVKFTLNADSMNSGETYSGKFRIQLTAGTEEKDYELYTGGQASPNPDYKQDIEVVTGDVEVKVQNKNLFDKNNANVINANIDPSTNPAKIIIGNSPKSVYIRIKPNTTYNVSKKILTQRFIIGSMINMPANGENITSRVSNANANNLAITTGPEDNYLVVHCYRIDLDTVTFEEVLEGLQIEEGSLATEYVEGKAQSYPLSLGSIELCGNDEMGRDYIYGYTDNWYKHPEWNKLVLNGIENINYTDAPNKDGADTLDTAYFQLVANPVGENSADLRGNVISNSFKNLYTARELWGAVNIETTDESISLQGSIRLRIKKSRLNGYTNDLTSTEKVTLLKTYLKEKNDNGTPVIIYYKLETPTDELITDETLISQLNALYKARTYKNITNITTETENVQPIMRLTYHRDLETVLNNFQNAIVALGGV